MKIYKGSLIGIIAAWAVLITLAIVKDYDNSTLVTFIMLAITSIFSSFATLSSGSKKGECMHRKRKSESI